NVACNFVGGVTMIPANGHRSWQESRDCHIEGLRWMIKNGVFPSFHSLRLGLGSIYGDAQSNRAKIAPTEYYLDAGLAHHEAMTRFGRYPTLNKLMLCPMDCLASFYAGELGMIALAGDIGKWLSEAIPDESNWLAQFISSVNPPEATQ
ncbi:MAG: hypothetical protein Q7O66_13435, partial [Dehalococcoidia bacterium]|nr:hypothetical protein [Dehalococcoidia bacterium]